MITSACHERQAGRCCDHQAWFPEPNSDRTKAEQHFSRSGQSKYGTLRHKHLTAK